MELKLVCSADKERKYKIRNTKLRFSFKLKNKFISQLEKYNESLKSYFNSNPIVLYTLTQSH